MTSMGQVRIDWERTPTVIELQSVSNICRADAQQERFSVYATLKLMSPEDQLDIVLRTAAITIESKPEAFRDLYLSALPPVPAF